jgi:hypothetical protein
MKTRILAFSIVLILSSFLFVSRGQKVYTVTSGELLFQSGTIEQSGEALNTNLRFTLWFHLGEYFHLDVGNNVGFYTGLAIRNVGFITDLDTIKTKYRSYTLGLPLAFKLGSFKDNLFVFGGAEYEWMFHFKQKTFIDDEKRKYNEWFSNATPALIPSVFAGVQFPGGMNVKFKYYLDNFLNHDYNSSREFGDFTQFTKTQVWYISMSIAIKNSELKNMENFTKDVANR